MEVGGKPFGHRTRECSGAGSWVSYGRGLRAAPEEITFYVLKQDRLEALEETIMLSSLNH